MAPSELIPPQPIIMPLPEGATDVAPGDVVTVTLQLVMQDAASQHEQQDQSNDDKNNLVIFLGELNMANRFKNPTGLVGLDQQASTMSLLDRLEDEMKYYHGARLAKSIFINSTCCAKVYEDQ